MNKRSQRFTAIICALVMAGALAMTGCGGSGSSDSPAAATTPAAAASTISGVAAVGYPIVGGNVTVKCASGSQLTTTTSSTGVYTVTLSGQTLPCAVEVSGGNIGSATGTTNATSYHSIATALGTVNVTPLTDLMVANIAAGDPSTWFSTLIGANLSPITTAQVDAALANLRAALTGLPPLSTINPITTSFTAISGNVSDDMLAALGTATAATGSYATLLSAAGTSSFTTTLNPALTTAYAGTTSGSASVGSPTITGFTPSSGQAGGSMVTITGTNFSATAANNTVKFNGVTAAFEGATTTQLIVFVPATATTGKITVMVGGQTATSATNFTVTAAGTGTNAALAGTWKMMTYTVNATGVVTDMSSFNMIEVLAANGDWTFTQPTAVVGVTCQQSGTSTSTATTITTTTVSDPCSAPSMAGTVETDTYTIAGTTLTANNGTGTFTYQLQTVAAISATATTTAQNLTVGTAMTSFSPLSASGGATPYTYSVTGTLPAGLSLNASTGAVTGTPNVAYAAANLVFSVKDVNNVVASTTSSVSFSVVAGGGGATVTKIAVGSGHTTAIKSDGTLWTWGGNSLGQLGNGTVVDNKTPTQIGADTSWTSIAAGGGHTVALKSDGTLWAWGYNFQGQLGDGTNLEKHTPTQIGAGTNWSAITAGLYYTIALKSDGTLWAWGGNSSGQLGNGTTNGNITPTQIGADTNWSAITSKGDNAGNGHTLALKTDGTLWAWGNNAKGQLGNGTLVNISTPTQIGIDTNWTSISAAGGHTVALKSDGTLWAWGNNKEGQLGDGTTVNKSSPTQIGTGTTWSVVATGADVSLADMYSSGHTVALQSDGTLWTWGSNWIGQLGRGGSGVIPTQVGIGTTWSAITAGNSNNSAALKTDGTLWTWGNNSTGQLGDGTTVNKSTPTPIAF